MKNKLFNLVNISFFIIAFSYCVAAEQGNIFSNGQNVTMQSKFFYDNQSICLTDCESFLTVLYPNKSIYLFNQTMAAHADGVFNFTITNLSDGDWAFKIDGLGGIETGTTIGFISVSGESAQINILGGFGTSPIDSFAIQDKIDAARKSLEKSIFDKTKYYFFYAVLGIVLLIMFYKGYKKNHHKRLVNDIKKELKQ